MDPNDLILLVAVVWLTGAGIIAFLAHQEGRSAIIWFAGGVLLSPLATLIGLLMVKRGRA